MDTTLHANTIRWKALSIEAAIVTGLAGLTVLASKIAIDLPWTPVPATLQVAAVIFAGAAFGPRRGAISQVLYLALGLIGVPVFADPLFAGPGVVFLPTFGYLLSFPLAAFLAGLWQGKVARWMSAAAALGAIYLVGCGWLLGWAMVMGKAPDAGWVLMAGLLPFLPFDLIKTLAAVLTAMPIRRRFE